MKTLNFFKRFCGAALVLVAMAAPMLTSCYDDSALNEKLEAVQNEVDQIKTDLTQLKSDLAALKAAVDANLSVSQLNQLPDGYELVFSDGTKAVIKNGTSSVVGAKEDEDGVLYWTLNGEWLLDADGNKIKASAEDGETPQVALTLDETDGYYYWTVNGEWLLDAEGNKVRANGIDGKEPVIKMYWSPSYGDVWVWNVNGNVLVDSNGEAIPAQGPAGLDGDAFFESVELSEDGTKLIITLLPEKEGEDNVVYKIPMGAFDIEFDAASAEGVTTDVKKFSYTVSGVSAGDVVIVRVLSTNATGVKVVSESATKGYVELELPSGEGYADIYALNNTTGDLKAKSLKLKGQDFSIDQEVKTALHFSPVEANEVTIPLTTGVEYEIRLSNNGEDWLDVTKEPRTKAVSYENLILKADPNNSGAHRKTTLTIKKKGAETVFAEFTVEQKNYDPSLIYDENEETIEWAESFGVSNSESGEGTPMKGVFTVALSDDFSKGVYKISNMFMAASYFDQNNQPVNNKGGEYYADIEGGVLTVHRAGSVLSYGFTKDFEVAYDASKKEFSISEPLKTYTKDNFSKEVYLVDYKAVVKVDEPETPGDEDSIAGEWTLTAGQMGMSDQGWGDNPISLAGKTMVISESAGNYVIEIADLSYTMTMTLSDNVLSSIPAYSGAVVLTLEYDAETQTLTQTGGEFIDYASKPLKEIVATKGGAESPLDKFEGRYNESYTLYNSLTSSASLTISVEGDKLLLKDMYGAYSMFGTYKAELSDDGLSLKIVEEIVPISMGSCLNQVLTVSTEAGKIVLTADGLLNDPYSGQPTFVNYIARQQ